MPVLKDYSITYIRSHVNALSRVVLLSGISCMFIFPLPRYIGLNRHNYKKLDRQHSKSLRLVQIQDRNNRSSLLPPADAPKWAPYQMTS